MKFNFNNTPKVKIKPTRKVHVAKTHRPKLQDDEVLEALANGNKNVNQVAKYCNVSVSTTNKVLFRLRKAGRIQASSGGIKQPYNYSLNGEAVTKKVTMGKRTYANAEEIALITDAILDFIARHDGESYSVRSIQTNLGLKENVADRYVRQWIRKGLLDKNFNQGKNKFKPETEDTPIQKETKPQTNFENIEFLVWNYVKETRSTDILAFITWLEAKNK